MTPRDFTWLMKTKGWAVLSRVVQEPWIDGLRRGLDGATDRCREIQVRNGLSSQTVGTAHHLVGMDACFDEFLAQKYLFDFVRSYFGGPFILNTFGGCVNPPGEGAYIHRVHRDVRTFTRDCPLMLNMLVMLDDFTLENGATYALSGSHHVAERPEDEFFFRHSERFLGQAGDVVLFDSNLWHSAGQNTSKAPRRALTIGYSRPFFKPQLDYPRYLSPSYLDSLDSELQQVIGLHARVPTNHDEWYQPPEHRFYRADQG